LELKTRIKRNANLVLLLLALSTQATAKEDLLKELNNLTPIQKAIMLKTFNKARQFNYEYTMTAIAWQESKFGKYKINLNDPSFGVFHNLISTVQLRHDSRGSWARSRLAERLMIDYDFSFTEALSELKYWENYWSNKRVPKKWSHTIGSYNGGFTPNMSYTEKIKSKIRALKTYFKNKGITW